MTDEHGMLRNGSIDSVGTAGRELNFDSPATSSTTIVSTTNSVNNTALPNNDGNNNENSTQQNSSNSDRQSHSQSQSQSHSPIDTENGNNGADNFVSSGCARNGNYSTATGNGSNANSKQPNYSINYSNSNNGSPLHNSCGGRLQFFKDGKFILELARSKEGDRGWISVPRKTYWPPAALSQNNLNNHKNESSTSLSFSDDNSSIQSSPWQRDHSWKQSTPRKNISKDLNLYYYRPVPIVLSAASKLLSKHIRRQPHGKRTQTNCVQYAKRNIHNDSSKSKEIDIEVDAKDVNVKSEPKEEHAENVDNNKDTVDASNGNAENQSVHEDEKMDYNVSDDNNSKLDENDSKLKINQVDTLRSSRKKRAIRTTKLSNVIEKLITRVSEKPMNVTVAQQTANIENYRVANGSPPRGANSNENSSSENALKNSRPLASANIVKNSHSHGSNESASQHVSKPISNYSIISLLGHNNSSNNSDSRSESNTDDKTLSENRGSPRSPMSYNHQALSSSRSTFVAKKKSPTNSGNALVNSPTNYRNARSPDINSPSPGLQQNSHHSRYHPASLSSPTSSFHPYLSSSRASPLSSGTLSPTDLYRHRPYRPAASPSTMSNSSISGLTHQYASLNGSPTAFANRYSPSTYSSSTKTSPTQSSQAHSMSSAYNVSNLLPQPYDVNIPSVSENNRFSPNAKHRNDWSPARNSATSGRGSPSNYANSNNSLSSTTIPKKTASIRQKYGSLSPNGFVRNENALSTKNDSHPAKKLANEPVQDSKPLIKRSKTPTELHKKPQSQELYDKDLQARYNAEVAAMHHQSLIASALQQQAANPFYHMYAGSNMHGANIPPPMNAAAAAAYMNPLYYPHPASEIFRKGHPTAAMDLMHKNLVPSWIDPYNASMMHFPPMSAPGMMPDKAALAAKNPNEMHPMLMSPGRCPLEIINLSPTSTCGMQPISKSHRPRLLLHHPHFDDNHSHTANANLFPLQKMNQVQTFH